MNRPKIDLPRYVKLQGVRKRFLSHYDYLIEQEPGYTNELKEIKKMLVEYKIWRIDDLLSIHKSNGVFVDSYSESTFKSYFQSLKEIFQDTLIGLSQPDFEIRKNYIGRLAILDLEGGRINMGTSNWQGINYILRTGSNETGVPVYQIGSDDDTRNKGVGCWNFSPSPSFIPLEVYKDIVEGV